MSRFVRQRFVLTYSIVTEDSARHGDCAYHGFVTCNETFPRKAFKRGPKNPAKFTLRDAVSLLDRHYSGVEAVSADSWPCSVASPPRWISVSDTPSSMAGIPDEGVTEVSLHLGNVSRYTAIRIARLLGLDIPKSRAQGIDDTTNLQHDRRQHE